jgi:hypothetical protein
MRPIKKTWTIHRYIEAPSESSQVLGWLREAGGDIEEVQWPQGAVSLHFKELGDLVVADDEQLDVRRSPLVTVFTPHVRRGILWTVGEVHFWATPLRQAYPHLHRLSRSVGKRLQQFECVFARGVCGQPEWEYHLEGSARNWDPPIFALPSGLEALSSGRYFIDHRDNDHVLDRLCKSLRLRGVQCEAGG